MWDSSQDFCLFDHRHAITSPSFLHWLAFKLSPSTECLFQLSYFSGLKFPFSSSYLLFLCRNFQCFHLFLSTFIIVYCNIFMMDALKSQVILTTLSPSNWYLIVFFIQFKILKLLHFFLPRCNLLVMPFIYSFTAILECILHLL